LENKKLKEALWLVQAQNQALQKIVNGCHAQIVIHNLYCNKLKQQLEYQEKKRRQGGQQQLKTDGKAWHLTDLGFLAMLDKQKADRAAEKVAAWDKCWKVAYNKEKVRLHAQGVANWKRWCAEDLAAWKLKYDWCKAAGARHLLPKPKCRLKEVTLEPEIEWEDNEEEDDSEEEDLE
jgi:hypothetical protein